MKKLIPLLMALGVASVSAAPKPKVSATAKITSLDSSAEVTSLIIGGQYGYSLVTTNANLLANRPVIANYVITVTPTKSTPVTISGKISLRPSNVIDGVSGATGNQTFTGTITIPELLPEGEANVSITFNTGSSGKVKFRKNYSLSLLE